MYQETGNTMLQEKKNIVLFNTGILRLLYASQ